MNADIITDVDVEESDIVCCLCYGGTSNEPNEIVICDRCNLSYHQLCHEPQIPSSVLLPDLEWICQQCTSLTSGRPPSKKTTFNCAPNTQPLPLKLPYDLNSLTWDSQHRYNNEQIYCYCGAPSRDLNMLQCRQCRQLFHEACLFKQPLLSGDRFFIFVCAICNRGTQYLKRLELKWADVVHLALYNMSIENSKTYYDVDSAILPFIESNWEQMRVTGEVAKTSTKKRRAAVLATLQSDRIRFKCGCETKKKMSLWGLRMRHPPPVTKVAFPLKQAQKMTSSFSPLPSVPQAKVLKPSESVSSNGLNGKILRQSSNITSTESSSLKTSVKHLKKNLKSTLENRKTTGKRRKCAPNGSHPMDAQTSRPANKFALSLTCPPAKESRPFSTISLNAMIPPPDNFEGRNHPFRNPNCRPKVAQFLMSKKSREELRAFCLRDATRRRPTGRQSMPVVRDHFASSKGASRFVLKTVDVELKENDALFSLQAAKMFADCGENLKVVARRVTIDGDVQYLIEWEGIVNNSTTATTNISRIP